MKRFLFGFLAALFLIFNTIPYLHIMADQSMTDSQLKQVGAFALSSLITTGEATELDFSDYTDSDTDFLLALGELVVTGDPSGLVECGLEWLGDNIDDAYDSAIQSIRTWEYNNLPDSFYYWFIDENPPYELVPSYNNIRDLSQPLRRLLTPPDDNSPTPNPDPDFSFIINDNDWVPYTSGYLQNIPFVYSSNIVRLSGSSNAMLDSGNKPNYTYYSPNGVTTVNWATTFYFSNITTIKLYYNSTLDRYTASYEGFNKIYIYFNTLNTYGIMISQPSNEPYNYFRIYSQLQSAPSFTPTTSFTGLSTAINYIHSHFRHYNLYVDDVLWVYSGNNTNYPIVIPDQLTIWNNQPLQYDFPSDTYLKLPDLTNIITNAINNSGVVMWSDIADCFVDINGQTAVAVTKIVRNDYDNLYMEQYPYPAMLPGMTDQTKFNEHLLDNSHAYLSPMGTVVQETVNVLPSELVGVLAIGAILTIFAVIINRLLE